MNHNYFHGVQQYWVLEVIKSVWEDLCRFCTNTVPFHVRDWGIWILVLGAAVGQKGSPGMTPGRLYFI